LSTKQVKYIFCDVTPSQQTLNPILNSNVTFDSRKRLEVDRAPPAVWFILSDVMPDDEETVTVAPMEPLLVLMSFNDSADLRAGWLGRGALPFAG
jgi:hypothetical protein